MIHLTAAQSSLPMLSRMLGVIPPIGAPGWSGLTVADLKGQAPHHLAAAVSIAASALPSLAPVALGHYADEMI